MKNLFTTITFLFITSISFAQTNISIDSVSIHIGEKVTVCSEVFGVKSLDKVTFINAGAKYPNAPLTIVIFAKDLPNFKDTPEKLYGNQKICVTGVVKEYKGKTEINVSKPEDIVVDNK
jgi:DNA/RNA endonuclease YhcR with UshA esterase domain